MAFLKHLLEFSLGLVAILGIIFLIITTYGWENFWERSLAPLDPRPVIFEKLSKGPKPNQALICPNDLCDNSQRDSISPVYNLAADDLRDKLLASVEQEERLERTDEKADPTRLRFVQSSKTMKFPDIIDVQFFQLEGEQSTLALYSRSRVGYSDLGVNKARLQRWLGRLEQYEAEPLGEGEIIKPAE